MGKITLTFDSVPLPEGWAGSPVQLKQILVDTLIATAEGDFLVGQIGGARPNVDSGIYIANRTLEVWSEELGRYVTADGTPIGTIIGWASNNPTPPPNYLICDGRTLQRTDPNYAELYTVIGFTWGQDGVDGFRLPNCPGRTTVYAGTGNYDLESAEIRKVGRMVTRQTGTYFGEEWVQPGYKPLAGTWQNPPVGRAVAGQRRNQSTFGSCIQPSICLQALIKYR